MSKLYLPGLNGLRAIAAVAVVYSHVNLNLNKFGFQQGKALDLASFGVTIFFTLSGFLITYLLFREERKTGTIGIKNFYVRRVLRIWPLYYLFIALALLYDFLLDSHVHSAGLSYYIFFAPNVPFVVGPMIPLISHYWSLGVEEQFYAFWPWIIKKIARVEYFLIAFIFGFVILKVIAKYADHTNLAYAFLHYTRFGCMAIGALGAYFYLFRRELLLKVHSPFIEILPWLLMILVAFNRFHIFSIVDHEILAVGTVVIIINQISNPAPLISLETKFLNYFGKISFGLYVYNPLVIDICSRIFAGFNTGSALIYFVAYFVVPSMVVGVSHVSYYYYESIFLRQKESFAVIKSSNTSESKESGEIGKTKRLV